MLRPRPVVKTAGAKAGIRHLAVLAGAALGLMVNPTSVLGYTFGVFLKPLAEEFQWQRGPASLIMTVFSLTGAIMLPLVGRLVDRFGPRRVLIPALVVVGFAIAALGLLPGNLWWWYAALIATAVVVNGASPVPYTKILVAWFVSHRGLALGIAISGVGAGSALWPIVSQMAIDAGGWRLGYAVLGLAVMLVGLPVAIFLLRDTPQELGLSPEGLGPADPAVEVAKPERAVTLGDTFRSRTFWVLVGVVCAPAIALAAGVVHLVPLLTDAGVPGQTAALYMGVLGGASIVGRIVVGALLDRFFAPHVACVAFLAPALACIALATMDPALVGLACAALLGIGMGAEVDVVAYMTSRYFSQAHFAEIYGYLCAAFMVGLAMGPPAMGFGFDLTGDYRVPLFACFACIATGCLLLLRLGPYPETGQVAAAPGAPCLGAQRS